MMKVVLVLVALISVVAYGHAQVIRGERSLQLPWDEEERAVRIEQ